MRLSDYHFPYVVLISKFLQYLEVDLDGEFPEVLKPSHEVNNGSLKMWFIKIGDKWVSKMEEHVGSSCEDQTGTNDGQQAALNAKNQFEHAQAEQGTENPTKQVAYTNYGVGPSAGVVEEYALHALVGYLPPIDHGIPMCQFYRLMINRLDNMASDQRNHYKFCAARFQHLDEKIEVVQTQLFEFQYGKDA